LNNFERFLFSYAFPENIALYKSAWQYRQFIPGNNKSHASNAVDGLKSDLGYNGGQCAVSRDKQQTATWRVDLGDILSIRHITIYYRTDNVPWGLLLAIVFKDYTCSVATIVIVPNIYIYLHSPCHFSYISFEIDMVFI
jgi:hypothetical protein